MAFLFTENSYNENKKKIANNKLSSRFLLKWIFRKSRRQIFQDQINLQLDTTISSFIEKYKIEDCLNKSETNDKKLVKVNKNKI